MSSFPLPQEICSLCPELHGTCVRTLPFSFMVSIRQRANKCSSGYGLPLCESEVFKTYRTSCKSSVPFSLQHYTVVL